MGSYKASVSFNLLASTSVYLSIDLYSGRGRIYVKSTVNNL